ncbi:amidohydrolase [Jeotgalibacillus proteolyticus]|nr:amidohydrolase [Jeotgalibacillus proteolyticus]
MELLEIFEKLHSIPEISWEEKNTTEYIEAFLKEHDIYVERFTDHTGLIAEVGSGKPVVGIRADINALFQELNGKMQANHSCGHDAHMTIAIGVLLNLKRIETSLQGTVRCLFQPAEEQGNGSLSVVKTGFVDDMDYLFGVHLRPKDELEIGKAAPSLRHGAAIFYKGKIIGDDAHGARPQCTVNAIDIGMALNSYINQLSLSPMLPHSIKMTRFSAGSKNPNIIPGSAEFSLDLRAQTNHGLTSLKELAQKKLDSIETLYGVKIEGSWIDYTPGAEVSREAEEILSAAIREIRGEENLAEPITTPGSDDFHFYTIERTNLKAAMLALGADLTPGLHHPSMTFDQSCLLHGVDILTDAVKRALNQ